MSCANTNEFEPITKGPLIAVAGLSVLAIAAAVYMFKNAIAKVLGQGQST